MSDILTRLKTILAGADERGLDETECRAIRYAVTKIERLRFERDIARQEFCRAMAYRDENEAQKIAQDLGWDCFKENTDGK